MNGNNEIREALAKYILNTADDSIVAKFKEILDKERENEIVAYTVQGEALTKEAYIQQIREAEKGPFISSEELKKRMLSW